MFMVFFNIFAGFHIRFFFSAFFWLVFFPLSVLIGFSCLSWNQHNQIFLDTSGVTEVWLWRFWLYLLTCKSCEMIVFGLSVLYNSLLFPSFLPPSLFLVVHTGGLNSEPCPCWAGVLPLELLYHLVSYVLRDFILKCV
jgi:hypothetical protein